MASLQLLRFLVFAKTSTGSAAPIPKIDVLFTMEHRKQISSFVQRMQRSLSFPKRISNFILSDQRVIFQFVSNSQSLSSNFHDRIVSVINAVLPEDLKITDIQYWFSALYLVHRNFSKLSESVDIMYCIETYVHFIYSIVLLTYCQWI